MHALRRGNCALQVAFKRMQLHVKTTKVGWHADDDVWMHARGVPGSHLIIRVPDGKKALDEDIQYAANLSAYFSKARDAPRFDITVSAGKHLKKFKGAKPGQVLVRNERVVTGVPHKSAAAAEPAQA